VGHSEFEMHSGRQLGGAPTNSGRQEQDGDSPDTRHSELGPQGEGWQGFCGLSSRITERTPDLSMEEGLIENQGGLLSC